MTHVSELETTTGWQPSLLQIRENRPSFEQRELNGKRFMDEEAWALPLNPPEGFRFPHKIIEPPQASREDTSFADMTRWGSVFGLLDTPTTQNHAISIEMPSGDWSWCAHPAATPRICLKKRMSILNVFDG
jgi:hypothetical protein